MSSVIEEKRVPMQTSFITAHRLESVERDPEWKGDAICVNNVCIFIDYDNA